MLHWFELGRYDILEDPRYEGYNVTLRGKPPFMVHGVSPSTPDTTYRWALLYSGENPSDRMVLIHPNLWEQLEEFPDDDALISMRSEACDSKLTDALLKYYDRRVLEQVKFAISRLDWTKVKIAQQPQFIQGMRIAKNFPEVGLKICIDAYDFDQWEVDWGNPMTYFNGLKEIIGLAGSVGVGGKPRNY